MDDKLQALLQSPYAAPRNIISHAPHTATSYHEGIYQTLPVCESSSLRLLRLHPTACDGLMSCSLEVFESSNLPEYYALSYTWGPPSFAAAQKGMTNRRCCPIICNGELMWVTANLLHFLLVWRSIGLSTWLWIDAICIDQDNIEERNQQLLLMTDIYTRASGTLVWLGEQDEFTGPAVRLLNILASADYWELRYIDPMKDCIHERELRGTMVNENDWIALTPLLERSWFTRIWIVQEMVVAEHSVVLCGNTIIPYNSLLKISLYILDSVSEWKDTLKDKDAEAAGFSIPEPGSCLAIINELQEKLRTEDDHKFTHVIIAGHALNASDPRDKIYALLGLCQWPRRDRNIQNSIIPDYTKTVAEVYTEATVVLLKEFRGLTNLSRVEDAIYRNRRNRHDLPSWVPDFINTGPKGIGFGQDGLYSASKHMESEWQIRGNGRLLSLGASNIDTVSQVGPHMLTLIGTWKSLEWLQPLVDMDNTYIKGGSKIEAFWRTLIGDIENGGYTITVKRSLLSDSAAIEHLANSFRDWFTLKAAHGLMTTPSEKRIAALQTLDRLAMNDTSGLIRPAEQYRRLADLYENPSSESPDSPDWWNDWVKNLSAYYDAVREIKNARFFTTKGGLMGLGTPSVSPGDSLWLLAGAEVPYILREKPDTGYFTLVGDAYVHGVMRGEAVELAREWRTVEIE